MYLIALALLGVFVLFPAMAKGDSGNDKLKKAVEESANATTAWLELVDKNKYGESWNESSVLMKKAMPKDEWIKLMDLTRKPLGNVVSRKVLDQRTSQNPKGLPKGDYMVMYYQTDFGRKKDAKELITLFLEDGEWRVMTYQVDTKSK